MKTIDYIKTIQKMNGWTYYRTAKNLNISQSSITRYKSGERFFDDETAIKVAELLKIDPAIVIADIHAERAKIRKTKEVWQGIAKALRAKSEAVIITGAFLSYSYYSMTYGLYNVHQSILCKIAHHRIIGVLYPLHRKLLIALRNTFINHSNDLYHFKRSTF